MTNQFMYKHIVEPFGAFEKHTLANDKGDSFSIVPEFGANLLDLQFDGKSILDGYHTPEELVENKWSKNIILFPFPNRLQDGQYTHAGKTYQFDINNAATGNAIHGFSKNVEMSVSKVKTTELSAAITCEYKHNGKHKGFPFKFTFKVTFILSKGLHAERGGEITIDMQITNTDTVAFPVGLGWHPYFKISDISDNTWLQMPECQFITIDDRMLPTGDKTPFTDFKTLKKINNTTLDNGFYITNQTEKAEVILQSDLGTLTYWQETGIAKWNFLQVFTPPHRQSIAIEPMTCNIDAFNNKDGLVLLTPKATLNGRFGVQFS
jgi:aldose 1-epimerase